MARAVRSGGGVDKWLLISLVVIAVVALVMPRTSRDAVAATLRERVLSPLVALESRAVSIRNTVAARPVALEVKGRAASQALLVQAVQDENETLRRLLGLGARLRDGFVVAELLPDRGDDAAFTLTLNVGSAAGVEPFSPVVTADGIVGIVEKTDANTSFAITWAHPDFRVSAMSVDSGSFLGIVQAHLGTGADRMLLEMRGVPYRAKLDTGTLIVSSGLGTTYPRGIAIGTVIAEISTPEKWARTYLLRPSVLPAAIGPVIVLQRPRVARGVEGVWTTVSASDSAAKAIALAGDSVARRAALAELAARRAAMDSLGLDSLTGAVLDSTRPRRPVTAADSARRDSARTAPRPRPDSTRPRPTGPPPATRPGPPTGPPPDASLDAAQTLTPAPVGGPA